MAVYKPTDCMPSGNSFDAINNRPIFIECKVDTNNSVVNGYSLEVFDEENNRIFPTSDEDHITAIQDLKKFFDEHFSDYGKGYINLNTGINGSYLKIPFIFSESYANTGTFGNNVPTDLSNGQEYSWKITLYQELNLTVSGGWVTNISLPDNEKYYDVVVCSGRTIGSTNERIQTSLISGDENIVSGLVLVDKYIQPVNIENLSYNPENPNDWEQGSGGGEITNSGIRCLIENYDDIYGHIYPSKAGNNALSPQDIGPETGNNGFRIYKNGNDPENLGVTDKAYIMINETVDRFVYNAYSLVGYEYGEGRYSATFNYVPDLVLEESMYVRVYDEGYVVAVYTYDQLTNVNINFYNDRFEVTFNMPSYEPDCGLFVNVVFTNDNVPSSIHDIPVDWSWVDTPANASQSHWSESYVTQKNPENGYHPFEFSYNIPDITIYGNERIIFNHMRLGSARRSLPYHPREYIYYGSCYNGIFSPVPSYVVYERDENGNPIKWNVTINWYRTTDANSWGQLLNKVIYLESGSTQPSEETDGDVFVGAGGNTEITIGGTAGIINKTPFMFVSEKPIRLFYATGSEYEDTLTPQDVGETSNIYRLNTTRAIGEVRDVCIGDGNGNYTSAPFNTWSYVVNSNTVFYTPLSGVAPSDMKVVYKAYREQDYTGVIFYNGSFDDDPNKRTIYIKPFTGIAKNMSFKYSPRESTGVLLIDNVNTKYWFINIDDSYLPAINTKYQICSNYRISDFNQFGLYKQPDFDVDIYNSMDIKIDPEQHSFIGDVYNIPTRSFRASISNYIQDDYILWESCCFNLYSAKYDGLYLEKAALINSTIEKYDGDLNCSFYGLEDENYYILEAVMITNVGLRVTKDVFIYANYNNEKSSDNVDISFNNSDLCVEIKFLNASDLIGNDIEESLISVYKREVWYYPDDVNASDPISSFSGRHSGWTLLNKNIKLGSKFKDYCVANNHYYEYAICRDVKTSQGVVEERFVKVVSVFVQYSGWSITNLHFEESAENGAVKVYAATSADVWRFKYNVSSGAQVQNISKTQQDTLSSHPRFSVGEKNFMNGSVSCLIGRDILPADYLNVSYRYNSERSAWRVYIDQLHNMGGYTESLGRYAINQNGNYAYMNPEDVGFKNLTSNESVDVINAWNNFVFSDSPKLLKDEKGRMFVVQLSSNSVDPNYSYPGMPTQISFDWVEVSDNKNIRVIDNTADGVIEIDGDSLDGGVLPALCYVGFRGVRTVEISNISKITEFGEDSFKDCDGIEEVLIKYDPSLQQETSGCLPGFVKWCSIIFDNNNSNPIHVSNGRGGNGVIIKYQLENGEYEVCRSFGVTNTNMRSSNAMSFVPTQHSVNGYKFLQECNISFEALSDIGYDNDDFGVFEESGLISVIIGDNVGQIKQKSFRNCYNIKTILFTSVTDIGASAFAGCSSLSSVVLPDTLTSIGTSAFNGCFRLTSINIPNSVVGMGSYVFQSCSQLSSVSIGTGLLAVARGAFMGCRALTSIVIPNNITSIADDAFYNCRLLSNVSIGTGVTNIGSEAFGSCSALSSITIPSGVISVGNRAFYRCTGLTSVVWNAISCQSAGSIVAPVFVGCYGLGSIEFGNSVVIIPAYLFYNCSGLRTISIPDSVTTIEDRSFGNCTGLTEIEIGIGVISIHGSAFYGCTNIEAATIPTIAIPAVPKNNLKTVTIFGGETIDSSAFLGCEQLTSVFIYGLVSSIGGNAFKGCSGITSFTITSLTPPTLSYQGIFGYVTGGFTNPPCMINVPSGSVNDYKSAPIWTNYAEYIQAYA